MYIFCNCKYERITDDARRSVLSRFDGCRRAVFNKALELQNDRKANLDISSGLGAPISEAELRIDLIWSP